MNELSALPKRFDIPGILDLEAGLGGLDKLRVHDSLCEAELYLHGATLTHWQPAGHEPVLFVSQQARWEVGRPIRGGVPICFPWFGAHASDRLAPNHGLARTRAWDLVETAHSSSGTTVRLSTVIESLATQFVVTLGEAMTMQLTVVNTDSKARTFEAALHTYFAIGDVHQASVAGLEQAAYIDTVGGSRKQCPPDGRAIRFAGETDRIYPDNDATCVLHDPALGRRIAIDKKNAHSTVVWNPWIERARQFGDFGDDEWQRMCCIESANIGSDAVTLSPGERHTMTVLVQVEHA